MDNSVALVLYFFLPDLTRVVLISFQAPLFDFFVVNRHGISYCRITAVALGKLLDKFGALGREFSGNGGGNLEGIGRSCICRGSVHLFLILNQ